MGYSVLVIDDEMNIRKTLEGVLSDDGYRVLQAEDGAGGLEVLSRSFVDAILLDVWMPDMDGLETLKRIREVYPILPVIMISGHGTIDTAVKAVKMGAIEQGQLRLENVELKERVEKKYRLIGESAPMQRVRPEIAAAGPTNASVLIAGENGSGKEIARREIHV